MIFGSLVSEKYVYVCMLSHLLLWNVYEFIFFKMGSYFEMSEFKQLYIQNLVRDFFFSNL